VVAAGHGLQPAAEDFPPPPLHDPDPAMPAI